MTGAPPCRSVLWNDRVGTLQAPRNLSSAATSRPFTVEKPCLSPYCLSPELLGEKLVSSDFSNEFSVEMDRLLLTLKEETTLNARPP